MIKRTHTCGELNKSNIGQEVHLNGWISKSRDLGGLIFIDLRDRYGKTQIVFNEQNQLNAVWVPNMIKKDSSLSRYEGFSEYKRKTRIF